MSRAARIFLLVTCEHGGNRIPSEYARLFTGWQRILATHRGFDAGALVMARQLSAALHAPLVTSTVSRLLIDLNRSLGNPGLWSQATRRLPPAIKQQIVRRHYAPYRQRVEAIVSDAVRAGSRVIHLSSHSFTPVLGGAVRNADVGLLYDPARPGESVLAAHWKAAFDEHAPELRVRRNYPYAGKNDGLTASLRRIFPSGSYVGIEIELNQALIAEGLRWRRLRNAVVTTAKAALR